MGDLRGQHGRRAFSALQLELFELVEGGYLGLAAAYVAATLAAGYACVRLGMALERRPEPVR